MILREEILQHLSNIPKNISSVCFKSYDFNLFKWLIIIIIIIIITNSV
jgi:hypothetical protein